jgi:hypothetical protein
MLARWIARLRFERSLGPVPNGARIVPRKNTGILSRCMPTRGHAKYTYSRRRRVRK